MSASASSSSAGAAGAAASAADYTGLSREAAVILGLICVVTFICVAKWFTRRVRRVAKERRDLMQFRANGGGGVEATSMFGRRDGFDRLGQQDDRTGDHDDVMFDSARV